VRGGDVDYTVSTRELLTRLAPETPLLVLGWTP
jgi:cytidine deaminase